jgi:tetratricopeptide (TPR) repeat protein
MDEEWKQKGNKELSKGNKSIAIQNYTEGLKINPKNVEILSNRSAVYLSLGSKKKINFQVNSKKH